MNKLQVGLLLTGIIATILLTITLFDRGVIAKSETSVGEKKFQNYTYVGPFDISNLKRKAAKEKLMNDFESMKADFQVNLIYQDLSIALPIEAVYFDIDKTLGNARSNEDNPMIVKVSETSLRAIVEQQLPFLSLSDKAIEELIKGIESRLKLGIYPQTIHVIDWIPVHEMNDEVIGRSAVKVNENSNDLRKLVHALHNYEIAANEHFSMLTFLEENHLQGVDDEEASIISSNLYAVILQTNFIIENRSIRNEKTDLVKLGFEANVSRPLEIDFSFLNPNHSSFIIKANINHDQLELSINGYPFVGTYVPFVEKVETYPPKVIKQFSAFSKSGEKQLITEGIDGAEAYVSRRVTFGNEERIEFISADFYPPVARIEKHPFPTKEQQQNENNAIQTDVNEQTGQNLDEVVDEKEGNVRKEPDEETNEIRPMLDKGGNPITD